MDMRSDAPARPPAGPPTRLLLKIASVDEETLRNCPEQDWDNARALAYILICNWLYLAALWSLIGHRLFSADGQFRPAIAVAGVFAATFLMLIDSYMFIRSGWHLNGLQELKRGGIDITGGLKARIKNGFFFPIRIGFAIGNSQLSAIFFCLLIFSSDITAHIHDKYLRADASLITEATARVGSEIQRETKTVENQTVVVARLSAQVAALRQNIVDPMNDPQIQQAEREVAEFIERKAKADDDLRQAEAFATSEAGGARGGGRSGQAGYGVRYRAAMEQVNNARKHVQGLEKELDAARARLDAFRRQIPSTNDAKRQQARDQLPGFEQKLNAENEKLTALKKGLAEMTATRETTIRKRVEAAPDYVPVDSGLIAQITVLHDVARENSMIFWVIVLVEIVAFGFETAVVLVKVTAYVPTSYSALLARDRYLGAVRIVDGMMIELNQPDSDGPRPPNGAAHPKAADDKPSNSGEAQDLFGGANDPAAQPPKRRRGRPRKHPLPDPNPIKGANGQEPPRPPSKPPEL